MTTPPVRDELARTLQQLRADAGLTLAEVAKRAGVSVATVSRLENGRYVPTAAQAATLAEAVGARASVRRRIVELAGDLRERTASRQVLLRAGGATAQRKFGAIEAAAGHVQSFSPAMVVGLLQTEEYARAVFASVLPPEQVEDAVRARLARQRLLGDPGGSAFTQVMTEGALRWHVGSPTLMAAQCERIAEVAIAHDRVRVGIIPWRRPTQLFPMHGFDLYDTRAAIVGTTTGTAFLTTSGDVDEYVRLFGQLVEQADFAEQAASVATRIATEYRSLTSGEQSCGS
ncbi:MAG: Scr1 family TA system antitoxin-like transcriptional regulator [Pseudonocardia sp.]